MLGKKSIMLICILLTASQACLAAGKQPSKQHFDSRGSAELNENETAHLVFMREEEKLARDVYTTLGLAFPKLKIFGIVRGNPAYVGFAKTDCARARTMFCQDGPRGSEISFWT